MVLYVQIQVTSSSDSPSLEGNPSPASSTKSSSGSNAKNTGSSVGEDNGQSSNKAYEIDKNIIKDNSNTIVASIILIIIVAFLIFVGYKRRKLNEE